MSRYQKWRPNSRWRKSGRRLFRQTRHLCLEACFLMQSGRRLFECDRTTLTTEQAVEALNAAVRSWPR